MAKIGLVDVDQTSFPNIALGKIARYHKVAGDEVEWVDPLFGEGYDKVYMSKIFTFTPDYDYPIEADEIERGGTGYDMHKKLPTEIDMLQPDYDFLGVPKDTAYGFTTKKIRQTKSASEAGLCSEDRSLISPDYARNFICDFILGKEQKGSQLTLF